jgi:hypothetical protein
VGVDAGVARSAGEILVLAIRNVLKGLGVAVLLGEAKVNHVDLVAALAETHEKIVRFDITMNKVFALYKY